MAMNNHENSNKTKSSFESKMTSTFAFSPASTMVNNGSDNNDGNNNNSHDNTSDMSQLPVIRAQVRRHVHNLAVHSVPFTHAQAYLHAMTQDSNLVLTESDPLQFVRVCKYDVWVAAQRLCLYWMERLRLFGPQRAFLPMTLTGTGALTVPDIQTLQVGGLAILPDTFSGQKCVVWDRRNCMIPGMTVENKLRAWFYIFSLLSQDDRTQMEPIMVLVFSSAAATSQEQVEDWEFVSHASSLVASIFPIQLRLHLLNIPSPNQPRQEQLLRTDPAENAAAAAISAFVVFQQCINMQIHIQMHAETENNRIFSELLSLGMTPKGIPCSVGGEWKIEDWYLWFQGREKGEWQEYRERLVALTSATGLALLHQRPAS